MPEDDNNNESQKSSQENVELEEELYDENYDSDTEESPETSSKSPTSTTSTTTSTTTTTTSTTTSRPIVYSSIKPAFNIILPNLKNKNTGSHLSGIITTTIQNKNVGSLIGSTTISPPHQQQQQQQQQQHVHFPPKELDSNGQILTGLLPNKNIQFTQTQRPSFGYVTPQNFNGDQYNKQNQNIDAGGFKQPSTSLRPFSSPAPPSTYKPPPPPVYDPFKNHFFSSTPTPLTPIFINNYNQKPQSLEEIRPSEEPKRPVVVLTHHFPTISPPKSNYDDFSGFPNLGTTVIHPYIRQKNRHVNVKTHPKTPQHPYLQQIQHHNQHHSHHNQHKANPTILALQSQQQKVHRLHQEGLEIAEHQIAQIASRDAEISNLRSQQGEDNENGDGFEPQPSHRAAKEIRTGDVQSFGKPSIAIVTSTSSTSSRVQKPTVITVQSVSSASGKPVVNRLDYKPEPEYKSELEKLFSNTEVPKKEEHESDPDMDLEQLLLAWKLKTNQEVTKDDIEKVFARLDTSKFKNGQTISLSDIFNFMNNESEEMEEETTRVPPMSHDEYTEEDVPYDPFYKDVPKVSDGERQKRDVEFNLKVLSEPFESEIIQNNDKSELFRTFESSGINLSTRFKERRKNDDISTRSSNSSKRVSVENLFEETTVARPFPETSFSCDSKIPGGYYADVEADCTLFHICSDSGNGR